MTADTSEAGPLAVRRVGGEPSGRSRSPLYWHEGAKGWEVYTLAGLYNRWTPAAPVVHVSYYEADAFARWAGADSRPRPSGRPSPHRRPPGQAQSSLHPQPGRRLVRRRPRQLFGERGSGPERVSALSAFRTVEGWWGSTTASSWWASTYCGQRVHHSARPRTGYLPKLLPAGGAVALHWSALSERCVTSARSAPEVPAFTSAFDGFDP